MSSIPTAPPEPEPRSERHNLRLVNQSYVPSPDSILLERPSHAQLRQLDSSLKRCTGFLRKLRTSTITQKSVDTLVNEANHLNLSRYISEIACAVADIKLRAADVPFVITFCADIHRKYNEFTSMLIDPLSQTILNQSGAKTIPVRKAALKLLVEMFTLALFTDVAPITAVLRSLIRAPKDSQKDVFEERCNNLIILASFARNASRVLLPPLPDSPGSQNSMWEQEILPPSSKANILSALQNYFDSDVQRLFNESVQDVRRTRAALTRSTQIRSTTDDPAAAAFETAKQQSDKLLAAANILAESISKRPLVQQSPDGTESKAADAVAAFNESGDLSMSSSISIAKAKNVDANAAPNYVDCPFEEEEQRLFYTELVTLKPKQSKSKGHANGNQSKNAKDSNSKDSNSKDSISKDSISKDSNSNDSNSKDPNSKDPNSKDPNSKDPNSKDPNSKDPNSKDPNSKDPNSKDLNSKDPNSKDPNSKDPNSKDPNPKEFKAKDSKAKEFKAKESKAKDSKSKDSNPTGASSPSAAPSEHKRRGGEKAIALDRLLGRLSSVQTRQDADKFALDFATALETAKSGPKRLAKVLYPVSAQKLNLLPAYSRVAANLKPVCGDTVTGMATSLEEDFKFFVGKSDVDDKELALCVKTAQYLGEYVKFGLVDVVTACDLLGMCLKDFSAHRVDVACHLLESCGRFAYLSPPSHVRITSMLDTIWRLKSVKNLEARHNTLIETAYFSVRLSTSSSAYRKKRRPPLHEYIRHLLYNGLDETNVRWTLNQLLKLPWDEELERYMINKFVNVYQARYSTIEHVAALVGMMMKPLKHVGIAVVDMLLEGIRAGMERNDGRESQRRIAEVRLLGELHNCNVVEEKIVYNVLYQLITLGHETGAEHAKKKKGTGVGNSVTLVDGGGEEGGSGLRVGNGGGWSSAPDPAGDFFRIRLTCLLLDTCGRRLYLSNGRKVEVVWIFMERYVFCKTYQAGHADRLPLHIEHLMSEIFQKVLSGGKEGKMDGDGYNGQGRFRQGKGLKRSRNLEEAVKAVNIVERNGSDCLMISVPEKDVVRSGGKRRGERGGVRGNVVDGFQTVAATEEEWVEEYEEHEEDEVEEEEEGEGEESDDEAFVRFGRRGKKTEEEEEFAKELASYTASAVQVARQECSVGPAQLDRMTIPMPLMQKKMEEDRAAAAERAAQRVSQVDLSDEEEEVGPAKKSMKFKLLVRKGGKSQLQGIAVPATSSLAVAARESESAHAQRHEETKRLILGSSTLLSDDDGDEDIQVVSAVQQAKERVENIRMQRVADERELLSSVFRKKGR